MNDPFRLTGQVAMVTGAASGLGYASAVVLAQAGATVVCVDIDSEGVQRVTEEIVGTGGRATVVVLDVRNRDQVGVVVEEAVATHGRLDVMANIAGVAPGQPLLEVTPDDLEAVLAVDLRGVLWGSQAAGRHMCAAGWGSIINMSSAAIDVPSVGYGAYGIAKAGVAQMTKTLAMELAPYGVRANAVAPGTVLTPALHHHFTDETGTVDKDSLQATLDRLAADSPLGQVGQPDDVAWTVLYLASPATRWMTGQILRPNGGFVMPW